MTRAEMLAELRRVLNAAGSDITWTDSELLRHLADGQDKFCEDTGFFRDKSTYYITLATSTREYSVSARVIEVLGILDGTRELIPLQADEAMYIADNGDPLYWRMDVRTGYIELDRAPSTSRVGDKLYLVAWCYSATYMADTGGEPVIPVQYQQACVEWAAFKAFSHHDIEKQDPVKAADHLAIYKQYARDGKRAFRRRHRIGARIAPSPVYVA